MNQRFVIVLALVIVGFLCGSIVAGEVIKRAKPKLVTAEKSKSQIIFAQKDWYKRREGKEQEFRGLLKAVSRPAGLMSTSMRAGLYRLGKYTIYTGAKKIPALDKLAGKNVVITGKAVSMSLEGRQILEIWPASIRSEKLKAVKATVKGLQVEVTPSKGVFPADESPSFNIVFKNVSKKGFVLYDAKFAYAWEYQLKKKTGEQFQAILQAKLQRAAPESTVLDPGKSLKVKSTLTRVIYGFQPVKDGKKTGSLLSRLKPGSYELTIKIRLHEHPQAAMMDMLYGYWSGTVVTGLVAFKISSAIEPTPSNYQ